MSLRNQNIVCVRLVKTKAETVQLELFDFVTKCSSHNLRCQIDSAVDTTSLNSVKTNKRTKIYLLCIQCEGMTWCN
jgi:hypothetical protein